MFAAAIPAIATAAAAGLGAWGQSNTNASNRDISRDANVANARQAQMNRDFQERMSNTSWQRGKADMIKAGINPMLLVSQGGASSPAGSSAQQSAGIPSDNPFGGMSSSAIQLMQLMSNIKSVDANTKLTDATTKKTIAETVKPKLEGDLLNTVSGWLSNAKGAAGKFGGWLGNKVFDVTHPSYSKFSNSNSRK